MSRSPALPAPTMTVRCAPRRARTCSEYQLDAMRGTNRKPAMSESDAKNSSATMVRGTCQPQPICSSATKTQLAARFAIRSRTASESPDIRNDQR